MSKTATKPYPEMVPYTESPRYDVPPPLPPEYGPSTDRLRLFWDNRRFLGRGMVAGFLIGILIAFSLPKKFESTTQLMPPDSQSSTGVAMLATLIGSKSVGGGFGGVAKDMLGMSGSGEVFVGILRSRTVQDRLIDRFDLQKVYGAKIREDARKQLAENTGIVEDRKSGIISITVTDRDPTRASEIAQDYVEQLDRLVSELSTSAAHRQRVFLEERLKEVKTDLETAEKEFSQFASKNTAIDIKEQGRAMVGAAADLEGQLIAAESELEGYRQIYTENNVRVKAARARITELKVQLEKLGGTDGSSPTEDKDSSPYPSIRKLPLLGVTYADLYRRTKIDEAVFEALTQQFEMAKVEEVKDTPSVKVLDLAKVPERKSFPPRLLIIFLSSCTALAGAAILTVLRSRWQEIDERSPRKLLAHEVFQTVRSKMPWASPNGSGLRQFSQRLGLRMLREGNGRKSEDS